jgi:diguanylate cyclase (GGDEF)-like protein
LCDVDFFKPYNDTYGHQAGDSWAILVAEEIRSQVKRLAISHTASQVSEYVTVSLGVASIIPPADIPAVLLLKTADEALYQAKRQGRDRCCMINPQDLGINQ